MTTTNRNREKDVFVHFSLSLCVLLFLCAITNFSFSHLSRVRNLFFFFFSYFTYICSLSEWWPARGPPFFFHHYFSVFCLLNGLHTSSSKRKSHFFIYRTDYNLVVIRQRNSLLHFLSACNQ